jgi:transcriptional regulator of met regulon
MSLQVVKPLLQERTKRKIRVLEGCGRDELLKVNDSFCHLKI